MLIKLALFPVLLATGCIFAGLYGALHDQVSYTVSPDYFHAFKFRTFDIPPAYHNRIGAAAVGWRASWWMGVFIGLPVLLIGLAMPDGKTYLTRSLVAFGVVTATALLLGCGSLAYACLSITAANIPDYDFPPNVLDKVAFARVAVMHEFSYLGGFAGIVTAIFYLIVERIRILRRQQR